MIGLGIRVLVSNSRMETVFGEPKDLPQLHEGLVFVLPGSLLNDLSVQGLEEPCALSEDWTLGDLVSFLFDALKVLNGSLCLMHSSRGQKHEHVVVFDDGFEELGDVLMGPFHIDEGKQEPQHIRFGHSPIDVRNH